MVNRWEIHIARLPRYFVEEQAQQLFCVATTENQYLLSDSDTHFHKEYLQETAEQQGLAIHAFVLSYIELNPVRAGMVKHPLDSLEHIGNCSNRLWGRESWTLSAEQRILLGVGKMTLSREERAIVWAVHGTEIERQAMKGGQ